MYSTCHNYKQLHFQLLTGPTQPHKTVFILEFVFATGAHPVTWPFCRCVQELEAAPSCYLHPHSLTIAPATFAGKDIQKERDDLQNEKGFINNESFIFPLRQRQISAAAERNINANGEGLDGTIMCMFEPPNMTLWGSYLSTKDFRSRALSSYSKKVRKWASTVVKAKNSATHNAFCL